MSTSSEVQQNSRSDSPVRLPNQGLLWYRKPKAPVASKRLVTLEGSKVTLSPLSVMGWIAAARSIVFDARAVIVLLPASDAVAANGDATTTLPPDTTVGVQRSPQFMTNTGNGNSVVNVVHQLHDAAALQSTFLLIPNKRHLPILKRMEGGTSKQLWPKGVETVELRGRTPAERDAWIRLFASLGAVSPLGLNGTRSVLDAAPAMLQPSQPPPGLDQPPTSQPSVVRPRVILDDSDDEKPQPPTMTDAVDANATRLDTPGQPNDAAAATGGLSAQRGSDGSLPSPPSTSSPSKATARTSTISAKPKKRSNVVPSITLTPATPPNEADDDNQESTMFNAASTQLLVAGRGGAVSAVEVNGAVIDVSRSDAPAPEPLVEECKTVSSPRSSPRHATARKALPKTATCVGPSSGMLTRFATNTQLSTGSPFSSLLKEACDEAVNMQQCDAASVFERMMMHQSLVDVHCGGPPMGFAGPLPSFSLSAADRRRPAVDISGLLPAVASRLNAQSASGAIWEMGNNQRLGDAAVEPPQLVTALVGFASQLGVPRPSMVQLHESKTTVWLPPVVADVCRTSVSEADGTAIVHPMSEDPVPAATVWVAHVYGEKRILALMRVTPGIPTASKVNASPTLSAVEHRLASLDVDGRDLVTTVSVPVLSPVSSAVPRIEVPFDKVVDVVVDGYSWTLRRPLLLRCAGDMMNTVQIVSVAVNSHSELPAEKADDDATNYSFAIVSVQLCSSCDVDSLFSAITSLLMRDVEGAVGRRAAAERLERCLLLTNDHHRSDDVLRRRSNTTTKRGDSCAQLHASVLEMWQRTLQRRERDAAVRRTS